MQQRVSLVTLGVRDLARARAFYEGLGWSTGAQPDDDVVFFQTGGMVVALWGRDQLAQDSGVGDGGGWGGVTFAYNVGSPAEVDAAIEEARAAGARIAREPGETFWGGYSGLFVDPDGHPWEVAHNPHWTLLPDGSTALNPPPPVLGLDHVQVAGPPGCEDAARAFYGELLGLPERPKPPELAARGGVWFDHLHVGIEDPFAPARKAHPALRTVQLDALAERLAGAGHAVAWDEAIPGVRRFYVDDPFGNRLEITT